MMEYFLDLILKEQKNEYVDKLFKFTIVYDLQSTI